VVASVMAISIANMATETQKDEDSMNAKLLDQFMRIAEEVTSYDKCY